MRYSGPGRDGGRIVTASGDDTARVWLVGWFDLLEYFRDATDECLTPDQRVRYLGEDSAEGRARHEACEAARRFPSEG